jgi:hypothetical protein
MEHAASLSGCVCVLLNWDVARQQFIESLKYKGISLLVMVISPIKIEIDEKKFPEVHVLPINAIGEELRVVLKKS